MDTYIQMVKGLMGINLLKSLPIIPNICVLYNFTLDNIYPIHSFLWSRFLPIHTYNSEKVNLAKPNIDDCFL